MGLYLGQLPPAEIARLKAELAETLIANFCYPRFFDYRTESLRMRPVDRAKRQEVWLYLSSVDFTTWGRIDLMSPDFQRQIERLFIQFVQRNRSFFGEQGRRRMADVRMLIGSSSSTVVQALRNHLMGQKSNGSLPFGSPRQVVSWSIVRANGKSTPSEPTWEQIAPATMLLQQQLQEVRGEAGSVKSAPTNEPRPANVVARRVVPRPQQTSSATNGTEQAPQAPVAPEVKSAQSSSVQIQARPVTPTGPLAEPKTTAPLNPMANRVATPAASTAAPVAPAAPVRKPTPVETPVQTQPANPPSVPPTTTQSTAPVPPTPVLSRPLPVSTATTNVAPSQRDNPMMRVGEDDLAIFEQMRHQMIVWLRVEAVRAGMEIAGQSPSQLVEVLRQQGQQDETRLQVVSTLLNLSNQVLANGQVSVLDYKQALMFHLMHTRG